MLMKYGGGSYTQKKHQDTQGDGGQCLGVLIFTETRRNMDGGVGRQSCVD